MEDNTNKSPERGFIQVALDYGRGNFVSKDKLYLVRCPRCQQENYAGEVACGQCAWCGWPCVVFEDKQRE